MVANTTSSMEVRQQLRKLLAQIDLDEAIRIRAVQDAISTATAATWWRRADMFEEAAPRPGDYNGEATGEDPAEATRRCRLTALACRQRAALLELEEADDV